MKRIITIIIMTAFAAVLMNSCQDTMPEIKKGVPMTIQASVVTPPETRTLYDYDKETKALKVSWDSKEAITVVSFDQYGITAVDKFTSNGEKGRKKAEFYGTWTGNEGDKVICLYPDVDSYGGNSIFDGVSEDSKIIYMRNLSTASDALKDDDPSSLSDVNLMLGRVMSSSDGVAHVNLEHQIAVFRIEATLQNLPYYDKPYYMARVNSLRIKCVNPNSNEEEEWGLNGDSVFVRMSGMHVTTESYTGKPFMIERGPQDYYLLNSGNNSDFHMEGPDGKDPVTKTFYVPVRFDPEKNYLEAGYELCFQFGGNYYDDEEESRNSVTVFPGCDIRKTITSRLPLENGKVYCFKVTI